MFNSSNHSSERSRQTQRRESTIRGSSTQKSRSGHSSPSSRRSEGKSWKIPEWVHCEKCFVTCVTKEDMVLLSCGHIFCRTCLRIENTILPNQSVPCPCCKSSAGYRVLNSSLDIKLHGMFCENWMDPVLSINLRNLQFMMMKSQNYLKFLSKSIKQNESMPTEWVERYNAVKSTMERNQKLKKFQNELKTKVELIKAEGSKTYKEVQVYTSYYARKIKSENHSREKSRQSQLHHTVQGNYEKNLKFVSSGRNEHSNQYIGQLKSSQRPNQNQSTTDIRGQRMVSQSLQRNNTTLNQYRPDTSSVNTVSDSRRPQNQSATFRPTTRDNYRFELPTHGQKRLAPSFNHDEYTTPSKRAAFYPVRPEPNLNTSNSSAGFSLDLNDSRYNVHTNTIQSTNASNRHESTRRIPKFK